MNIFDEFFRDSKSELTLATLNTCGNCESVPKVGMCRYVGRSSLG